MAPATYVDTDTLLADCDPQFAENLLAAARLHAKKRKDYGTGEDCFANVRASEDFGIPAWLGVAIRLNDKMRRVMSMAKNGRLENESFEDSCMDIIAYGNIMLCMWQEAKALENDDDEEDEYPAVMGGLRDYITSANPKPESTWVCPNVETTPGRKWRCVRPDEHEPGERTGCWPA